MSVKATIEDQLKGNLNKKFGDNLPIPFIEKIMLKDDVITLSAAIYFNLDEYSVDNFGDFMRSLGDVRCYAMMALDREYTATSIAEGATVTDNAYSDIISGKRAVLGNLQTGSSWMFTLSSSEGGTYYGDQAWHYLMEMGYPNGHNLYDLEKLAEWELADTYYNEAGKPVNKLVNTIEIPVDEDVAIIFSGYQLEDYDPDGDLDYVRSTTEGNISLYEQLSNTYDEFGGSSGKSWYYHSTGSTIVTNAGFIAFSSILDLNDTADADYTETDEAFEDNDSMKYLYGSLISDMNYVSFFKDGEVDESKEFVYVKPSGEVVLGAVQALDGYYYAPAKVNLPKIVALFKTVSAPPISEEDQSALATLLAINATNSGLLTQINIYLNTFYEKTSATPLGKYYLKLRKRLAAINILVKQGARCSKQLVTNPIVQDFRGTNYTSDYEWDAESGTGNGLYTAYSAHDPGEYIYTPSVYMQRMTGSLSGDTELVIDKGFVFFNYEKALKQQSNLAHLVNVQKVEDYFGHNCLTSKFAFEKAELKLIKAKYLTSESDLDSADRLSPVLTFMSSYRFNWHDNGVDIDTFVKGIKYTMTLNFDSSNPNVPVSLDYDLGAEGFEDDWVRELTNYGSSYLQLRNFNLPVPDTLVQSNGSFYKLMCFEFQNILEGAFFDSTADGLDPDEVFKFGDLFYSIKLTIDDNTLDVFDDIRTIAAASLESFNQYAELALDLCAYNEADSAFNQFFINAAEQKFGTSPSSAPFLYAPLVYNYLLDIFTNAFDGDKLEIFEATKKLSDTIAPWAGTRMAIEQFQTNFEDLIYNFLNKSGEDLYKKGGHDGRIPCPGYPESVGQFGQLPTQFEIQSTIVEQLYPIGVDLSDYTTTTGVTYIEAKCSDDDDCESGYTCWNGECITLETDEEIDTDTESVEMDEEVSLGKCSEIHSSWDVMIEIGTQMAQDAGYTYKSEEWANFIHGFLEGEALMNNCENDWVP